MSCWKQRSAVKAFNYGSVDRVWLRRVAQSLVMALVAGLLVYLVARGVLGAWLFVQQQQLLRDVVGAVQSGLDAPPSVDLRAIRQEVQALDERNSFISMIAGFVAAAFVAAGGYVWLERRNET